MFHRILTVLCSHWSSVGLIVKPQEGRCRRRSRFVTVEFRLSSVISGPRPRRHYEINRCTRFNDKIYDFTVAYTPYNGHYIYCYVCITLFYYNFAFDLHIMLLSEITLFKDCRVSSSFLGILNSCRVILCFNDRTNFISSSNFTLSD